MTLSKVGSRRLSIGLRYLRTQWRTSIIFFFVIFAFFLGFAFLISPFASDRVTYGGWRRWGDSGLFVFGLSFVTLSLWSVFWPDGAGGVITTATLSCIGLATSTPPLSATWNIAGIIFYGLILGTILTPVARTRLDSLARCRLPGRRAGR